MTEFEQIYSAYFHDVFLYIRKLSGNEHIAEEITSETFFKAMKSIGSFRGDCEMRVWLCQIAKNCYHSYLKKIGQADSLDDASIADTGCSVEEKIAQQDEISRIRRVLHTLPEPYKEVFMWRVFGELSFRQIGQIFNKSENWACVTYHRAKIKIKEGLEE